MLLSYFRLFGAEGEGVLCLLRFCVIKIMNMSTIIIIIYRMAFSTIIMDRVKSTLVLGKISVLLILVEMEVLWYRERRRVRESVTCMCVHVNT